MRRKLLTAVSLITAVLVAGCSTAPTDPDTTSGATPTTLTVVTGFAIDNLDPVENGFWAPEFGYGDLLMRPLRGGKLTPWVLSSLTATSPTVWELTLRPNVTFQNGTKLDAANLAALLTFHLGRQETAAAYFPGATATASGPLTVTLTTREPVTDTPSLLANEAVFPLFDLAAYQRLRSTPDKLVAARIYLGPYTVTSLTPERMRLAPTRHYYGGTPPLTALTVRFVPDAQARIRAVQAGEADLALYPPTAAHRQLATDTRARYLVEPEGAANGGPLLFLNLRNPALTDVRVRQALQRGTDYRQLSDQVMNGLYDTSRGIYPAFVPYGVDMARTDRASAGKLLDQAGWRRAGTGVRSKDGRPLTLTVLTYPQQPDVGAIALGWQSQLRGLGVDLRIREVEDISDALSVATGWDLGVSMNGSLGMTGTDPVRLLVEYYRGDGENNHGGVRDTALDALIDQVRRLPDSDARRAALLRRAQRRIVADQAYGWYLAYKRTPVVVRPALASYPVPVANLWLTPYS